ncbi:hypothetical protein FNH13_09635 [Ornithinimicrobium ciconiae]|uniref:Nucleotidyltransferase domain-containing protein n=1 Tax=Ornithinimicrobium ciconiae TaxID=2594265 RepID=A0A516GAM1_9MICO|nr:hypothetical protein [Ornithinimicrobium ciconiae]QDO88567.1 hypothetical protein FNH13_09635 [Ornithinimicrobium ciconiae]
MYGSWSRGDADADSDLDVMVLNFAGVETAHSGRVNVTQLGLSEVKQLSGTLFGYHLVRDGRVLYDIGGQLAAALEFVRAPGEGQVIGRVRSLTSVLDISSQDRERYIEGLTKVARYLLRSALYAEALDQGDPCFSVREIAARKRDPQLVAILSSHVTVRPSASEEVLDDLKRRLEAVIGPLQPNPHGDLHGLIERTWRTNRDLSNFATLALSEGTDELPYDELPRVTL